MNSGESEPKQEHPDEEQRGQGSAWTRSRSTRARAVIWGALLLVIAAFVAYLLLRDTEPTSERNAAYSLEFPSDYTKADAFGRSFAITKGDVTVVLLSHRQSGDMAITIDRAKQRLHNLTCAATPRVVTSNDQQAVVATAPRPCSPFGSTAIVFGSRYRVLVSCDAPSKKAVTDACQATLANLHVN